MCVLGALVLDKTELHLMMTSTHFVDDSLMDAVISNDDHCNSVISNIERYPQLILALLLLLLLLLLHYNYLNYYYYHYYYYHYYY